MRKNNPFYDPEIAADCDAWYYGKGKKSAEQEKALLKKFIARYKSEVTVLEVGCSTGYFSDWFRTLSLKAVGIDSAYDMLQQAQEIYHLSCVMGNAKALPFSRRSFDLVVLITTLEFIVKPKRALQEALRVARSGMILGVINRHSLIGWHYQKKGGPIWGQA
jgi:ubiquinone/menaquinone biosynthesis C-methylase UbiE